MSIEGGFFTKQSGEAYPVSMPFKHKLPDGASINNATVSAIDKADGSDVTATILADTACTVSGTDVIFGVQAGTNGHRYKITVIVILTTTPGTLEEDIDMLVKDT